MTTIYKLFIVMIWIAPFPYQVLGIETLAVRIRPQNGGVFTLGNDTKG